MFERLAALAMIALVAAPAAAFETVVFDRACAVSADGVAPLRQTIVVLDEAAVSKPGGPDRNGDWRKALLEIAGAVDGFQANLAPHERLEIFLARSDGSELTPVFSGCSPTISDAQRRKLEATNTFLSWAFTGGPAKTLESNAADYKNALADAVKVVLKMGSRAGPAAEGSLLRAIATTPRLVDLAHGVPRIVVISPLDIVAQPRWASVKEARQAGFDLAAKAGVDFQRAEIHVVALSAAPHRYLRDFAEAFFLRSRGYLAGWRTGGLPQLPPPPVEVRVFGGTVAMGEVQGPVQIRVAYDAQGTLINSWIEVTTGRSLATPISGKSICRAKDVCVVQGDGKLMGQAWNPEVGGEPVFDPQFAWSGLRYFELTYQGADGTVRIWDPKVGGIQMGDRRQVDFRFSVHSTNNQQF